MIYDETALARMDACNGTADDLARELHNHPKDWKNEWVDLGPTTKVRRPNINFGHLALTETIEFRVFMTTTNPTRMRNIIAFPLRMIRAALTGDPDPVRIARGLDFQEQFSVLFSGDHEAKLRRADRTTRYMNTPEQYRSNLGIMLINKEITLADLNYPQFWIDKGFG